MKLIKKITVLLMCLILMTAFAAVRADAAGITAWGVCGENLQWVLMDDGTLTISGTGPMDDYSLWDVSPWLRSDLVKGVQRVPEPQERGDSRQRDIHRRLCILSL